jgi:hypothetical protein
MKLLTWRLQFHKPAINYCSHSTTKQQMKELKFIKRERELMELKQTTYQNQLTSITGPSD